MSDGKLPSSVLHPSASPLPPGVHNPPTPPISTPPGQHERAAWRSWTASDGFISCVASSSTMPTLTTPTILTTCPSRSGRTKARSTHGVTAKLLRRPTAAPVSPPSSGPWFPLSKFLKVLLLLAKFRSCCFCSCLLLLLLRRSQTRLLRRTHATVARERTPTS